MDLLISLNTMFNGQSVITAALAMAVLSIFVIAYCLKKQSTLLKQVNKLSEDLRISNRGAIGMGQQIIALEKQLQRISANAQSSRSEEIPPMTPAIDMSQFTTVGSQTSSEPEPALVTQDAKKADEELGNDKLNLARDLLAKGKELTEVANTCQLSFAEVSLLRALNPSQSQPNQPHTH